MNEKPHGWKTYLAGGASIIWGAKMIFVDGQINEGLALVIAGFALFGIRGAFAKLIKTQQ